MNPEPDEVRDDDLSESEVWIAEYFAANVEHLDESEPCAVTDEDGAFVRDAVSQASRTRLWSLVLLEKKADGVWSGVLRSRQSNGETHETAVVLRFEERQAPVLECAECPSSSIEVNSLWVARMLQGVEPWTKTYPWRKPPTIAKNPEHAQPPARSWSESKTSASTDDRTRNRRTFDVEEDPSAEDEFLSGVDIGVVDSSKLQAAAVLFEAETTLADGTTEILRSVLELQSDSESINRWKGRLDLSGLPDSHDGHLTLTIKCLPSELHLLGTTRNALGDLLPIVNYASLPIRQVAGSRYEFAEPSGELLKTLTDGKAALLTFALKVTESEVQP